MAGPARLASLGTDLEGFAELAGLRQHALGGAEDDSVDSSATRAELAHRLQALGYLSSKGRRSPGPRMVKRAVVTLQQEVSSQRCDGRLDPDTVAVLELIYRLDQPFPWDEWSQDPSRERAWHRLIAYRCRVLGLHFHPGGPLASFAAALISLGVIESSDAANRSRLLPLLCDLDTLTHALRDSPALAVARPHPASHFLRALVATELRLSGLHVEEPTSDSSDAAPQPGSPILDALDALRDQEGLPPRARPPATQPHWPDRTDFEALAHAKAGPDPAPAHETRFAKVLEDNLHAFLGLWDHPRHHKPGHDGDRRAGRWLARHLADLETRIEDWLSDHHRAQILATNLLRWARRRGHAVLEAVHSAATALDDLLHGRIEVRGSQGRALLTHRLPGHPVVLVQRGTPPQLSNKLAQRHRARVMRQAVALDILVLVVSAVEAAASEGALTAQFLGKLMELAPEILRLEAQLASGRGG